MTQPGEGPGRPTFNWTDEIETEIFKRISNAESLISICADDWMPSESTVYKRLREDEQFSQEYTRARERQADHIFDEVLAIADGVTKPEDVAAARLRIDARKWMAGKLRPKVYSDKTTHEHSGPDGEPIKTSLTVSFK